MFYFWHITAWWGVCSHIRRYTRYSCIDTCVNAALIRIPLKVYSVFRRALRSCCINANAGVNAAIGSRTQIYADFCVNACGCAPVRLEESVFMGYLQRKSLLTPRSLIILTDHLEICKCQDTTPPKCKEKSEEIDTVIYLVQPRPHL